APASRRLSRGHLALAGSKSVQNQFRFLPVPASQRKNMLTRASTIAPTKAAPKVSTWKPGTTAEASSIMAALITSQNSPRVSSTRGKVTIFRKTPSVALTKPITSAAINAASGPLTWKPGTTLATIQTASALKAQFRRCFMALSENNGDYRPPSDGAQLSASLGRLSTRWPDATAAGELA